MVNVNIKNAEVAKSKKSEQADNATNSVNATNATNATNASASYNSSLWSGSTKYISTGTPTGGVNGDIWFQII